MKKFLVVMFLFLIWIKCYPLHYFVSATGNDSNNGLSTGTPFKTINKVNTIAFAAGDIVSFNGGDTFVGTLNANRNGGVGNVVTYNSYGTGQATITGLVSVTSWTNATTGNTNIWESVNPVSTLSQCNIVVINGVNTAMGRTPNTGYYTIASTPAPSTITLSSSSLNAAVINYTNAEVCIRKVAWITDRSVITSASGTTINFNTNPADNIAAQVNWGFFIEDDVRTLDLQNEWYYNPQTKKIRIFSSSSPTNVQVSTVDTLLKTSNRHDITVDNIAFTGSNLITMQIASQNVTVQNCTFDYAGVDCIWGAQNLATSTGFIFQNNSINHTNNNALVLRDNFSGALIQNNLIQNTGLQEGMLNRVSNSNQFGMGLELRAVGIIAQYNTILNSGYAGIEFFANNDTIRYNYIDGATMTLADGGGIYTFVGFAADNQTPLPAKTGQAVYNNIVLNSVGYGTGTVNSGLPQGQGIYFDDCTGNILAYNNTVANSANSGQYLHNTLNMNVHDNTYYNCGNGVVWDGAKPLARIRNMTFKKNISVARDVTQNANNPRSAFDQADIQSFGTPASIDSNVLARPIDNVAGLPILVKSGGAFTNMNLAQWVTFSLFDSHSTKSPVAITNVNQLFFYYNPTNHDSTVSIVNGIDMHNVSYSGTTVLHQYSSLVLINTTSQTTPTITWANPAAITYPTPLSATQLNATANTAGTFVYSPASGTVLNAGTQTLNVTFTPTDGVNWTTATKQVTIIVNQAAATLTYSNLTQTYTGSPLSPTITTNPAGLTVVNTTYNGVGSIPVNAGVYTVVSGLTNMNYSAPPISGTFTINKASATINISNLNQVYDGTPKPITASTSPVGLSGLAITYNGSSTAPTGAGSYAIIVTLTNPNYTATNATGTLTVAKATPTVTWSNPGAITYPAPLSGTQLNATASVAGTFTYTPNSGTILNAGTNVLSVNFTPTDAANYNSVLNTTVTIVVNQGTATISVSNLNQIFDGTPKSVVVTTNPVGLDVLTILYNGSSIAPSAIGSYTVNVTLSNSNYVATPFNGTLVISASAATIFITNLAQIYSGSPLPVTVTTNPVGLSHTTTYNGSNTVPTNVGSYVVIATINDGIHTGADTQTFVIIKATVIITWSNPSNITYGTALSATQLNASTTIAGSFVYTPTTGSVLNVGTQSLSVVFTPTDAANYNSVTKIVSITVVQATATLAVFGLLQSYNTLQHPVTVVSSPSGLSGITILYNGSSTPPTNAGTYSVTVTLSNTNYVATPLSATLVVVKAIPILSWTIPAAIMQGQPLTATQLNATASIAGTFAYVPPIGTIMNTVGTVTLTANFTPTDSVNYNTGSITVPLGVYGTPVLDYWIKHGNDIYRNLF